MPMDSGQSSLSRRAFLKRGILGACAAGGVGASYAAWTRSASRGPLPSIVLITLDTMRADHLGCYGYTRPTSPNLDRFAAESIVYENAMASATWTLPSHASLFTGKFTASHGACKSIDGQLDLTVPQYGPDAWNHYRARPIAVDERTLAMFLKDAGYSTSAVVAGPWMKEVFGLSKGFDVYDDDNITTVNARAAEEVTNRALELMSTSSNGPQFLFLNYFDPHFPYSPPEEFARKLGTNAVEFIETSPDLPGTERMVRLYDAEVLYLDHHLGRLFEGLRQLNAFDDAWVVVTADHGELLGEHGAIGHPGFVYQESVHVPLIVKPPQGNGLPGRVETWIQLVDVFPMLLDAARVELPEGIQGNRPSEIRHPIIIESRTLPGINEGGDWFAIIEDGWKYIWSSEGNHMLFHLDEDPKEQNNLFVMYPERCRTMGDQLHAYLAGLPDPGPPPPVRLDKKMQAKLKSLGYLK